MEIRERMEEHVAVPEKSVPNFLRPSRIDDQKKEDRPEATDRGLPPDHVTATYWG